MKKILFFGELPPKTIHGVSISNQINLKILKKYFDIVIIEEFSSLKFHDKFSIIKIFSFLNSYFSFLKNSILSKYEFFYGVIYLSTFGILKNIVLVFTFKFFHPSAKAILHFHRSDFEKFVGKKRNFILFKILDSLIYKYIVLSEKQKSLFGKRTDTLCNTIQLEFNKKVAGNFENDYALFIGNYIKEKGVLEIIEAVKKYNNVYTKKLRLLCYGNVSDFDYYNTIKNRIGTDPFIILNGPIYDELKMKYIQNARFTILPSYNEGMPLILLESLSVGTPMIITNVGFISDALGDDYPLYCYSGDIDSIFSCFITFDNFDDIKKFKNNLIDIYRNNYSHQKHENQLLRIFKNQLS